METGIVVQNPQEGQRYQTLSGKLTWSHYIELLKIEDPLERSFYEQESAKEN